MTEAETKAAPDPVKVVLTSNQLALLIELGQGRELCHSEDGEIAWLDTARNGDRWFDINWKDMAALRDAGYLRSAEDHRFHVELISEAGNRALARAMQEAMRAQGGEPVAWQWRSRVSGGAWDTWEHGKYGADAPHGMEIEERCLYAAPPAKAEVRVKSLVWELRDDGAYQANSTIGCYYIFPGTGFSYDLCGPVGGRLSTHKRRERAQDAGEADYEQRIRSGLVEDAGAEPHVVFDGYDVRPAWPSEVDPQGKDLGPIDRFPTPAPAAAPDGLVERLRKLAEVGFGYDINDEDRSALKEAAARIEADAAEIEGWRDAAMQAREGCNQRSRTISSLRRHLEAAEARVKELEVKADRFDKLRELAGYDEDGSSIGVSFCQDDATRDWVIHVGKTDWYHGRSLEAAIDKAAAALAEQEGGA